MKQLWAPWRMTYLKGEHKKVEGCLFCAKLDQDDAEEQILYRGEYAYVTLNRFPYTNGHLLIVPYVHTGLLEELDDAISLELMRLVRASLGILRQVYRPDGFNIGVNEGAAAGAGVAEHVHIHIVPRWSGDVNYMTVVAETRIIPQTLEETYTLFRPCFERLNFLS
ncbi:MAG: HIT domain-containing protein [Anaerolineae bacterium]|nr:HIT domain-containing protein [Anaerolineae bacterium]